MAFFTDKSNNRLFGIYCSSVGRGMYSGPVHVLTDGQAKILQGLYLLAMAVSLVIFLLQFFVLIVLVMKAPLPYETYWTLAFLFNSLAIIPAAIFVGAFLRKKRVIEKEELNFELTQSNYVYFSIFFISINTSTLLILGAHLGLQVPFIYFFEFVMFLIAAISIIRVKIKKLV